MTAEALSGRWSSAWGETRIDVKGTEITGSWRDGAFSGSVGEDGVASVTWTHRDGTSGKGTLKADDDRARLTGTWGWDSDADGGAWELTQLERTWNAPAAEPAPAGDAPTAGDAPGANDAPGAIEEPGGSVVEPAPSAEGKKDKRK